ncbi:MAG TPA: NUDIX hydrolase [Kiritimatiellia bacterium]|nr:NUDIX hydrolase [Kiritimatiellia bacterium]HMO98071.1 NUDIX hydrolase [Kiritimatiellia bacterium]HMP97711.1 NUDIX hydrolase [Kiritimatiellia bacterium]
MRESTLHTRTAFAGKLLRLEQLDVVLEDGRPAYREIVRHPGAVGVLARLPGEQFVLVRQYRKAVEAYMLEVVAGLLDPGEAPEAAARRELREETGRCARSLTRLGVIYASPGYVDERVEIFLAELEDGPGEAQQLDHGEAVETVIMDREALAAAITGGAIHDAKTLAAWALLLEHERAAYRAEGAV